MKLPRIRLLIITDKHRWEREVTVGALLFLALVGMISVLFFAKMLG